MSIYSVDTLLERIETLETENGKLREALAQLLKSYVELVQSGDCGFWNPEDEDEVKAARSVLSEGGEE